MTDNQKEGEDTDKDDHEEYTDVDDNNSSDDNLPSSGKVTNDEL